MCSCATDAVRARVAAAAGAALLRLAGGGCAAVDAAVDGNGGTCAEEWREELRELARASVSFPNGGVVGTLRGAEGKPHDVEVRAAPALYHRARRKCGVGGGTTKGTRKRRALAPQKDDRSGETGSIELISEWGTRREVDSARALAHLLSIEMERELNGTRDGPQSGLDGERPADATSNDTVATFADIRPDDSGIVCLVSTARSEQLRAAGRMPCAHCTSWAKGARGLWWHQLAAHGIDYSSATEAAAGAADAMALVPYRGRAASAPAKEGDAPDLGGNGHDDGTAAECDAFRLVKAGRRDAFVALVETGAFRPASRRDRNGATALHWAAGRGRREVATYLIETCGCPPDQPQRGKRSFRGRTPLHWAARNGHLNVVEYLVEQGADIDAKTSDGTTAFCWASWQGHLDIMKFLHRSGCDVHASNSFGCNAVLWSAQGAGTSEILAWLLECGLEFGLVNSNGHGALHKAAQRGCDGTVKWLVDKFLFNKHVDGSVFVGPDAEGNCPSDLCGMEGHESLANWIAKHECDYFVRRLSARPMDCAPDNDDRLPSWLEQQMDDVAQSARTTHLRNDDCLRWGAGCGVRRIVLSLLGKTTECASASKADAAVPKTDFSDID